MKNAVIYHSISTQLMVDSNKIQCSGRKFVLLRNSLNTWHVSIIEIHESLAWLFNSAMSYLVDIIDFVGPIHHLDDHHHQLLT